MVVHTTTTSAVQGWRPTGSLDDATTHPVFWKNVSGSFASWSPSRFELAANSYHEIGQAGADEVGPDLVAIDYTVNVFDGLVNGVTPFSSLVSSLNNHYMDIELDYQNEVGTRLFLLAQQRIALHPSDPGNYLVTVMNGTTIIPGTNNQLMVRRVHPTATWLPIKFRVYLDGAGTVPTPAGIFAAGVNSSSQTQPEEYVDELVYDNYTVDAGDTVPILPPYYLGTQTSFDAGIFGHSNTIRNVVISGPYPTTRNVRKSFVVSHKNTKRGRFT